MRAQLIKPRFETPDPPGVIGTYGDQVIRWAKRELGRDLDDWQQYVLRKALRYDDRGHLIHRTALWSTGRQNGKTVIVRSLYGWLLDPRAGGKIEAFRSWEDIATAAHDSKQARIPYKGVYRDLKRIRELTYRPRAHGETGERPPVYLTLQAGIQAEHLTFDILTAESGAARGGSLGALAWDELLTQRDWEMFGAVAPTQSFQVSPIMLLTSTAGTIESVVLRSFYDQLVRQSTGDEKPNRAFWGAWWQSSDPDAGLDWDQIRQANPSPRLSREAIEDEYQKFPADQWRRERLNHWSDGIGEGAFGPGQWARCRTPNALQETAGTYALGVGIGPDWQRASVVAAAPRDDGRFGAAVVADLRASSDKPLTAQNVIDAVRAFPGSVAAVAFEGSAAGAPSFEADAYQTGHPWDKLSPSAVVAASMDVAELVQAGLLAVDDPLIDAQVASAGRRKVGMEGAFRFARSASAGPIDAFLAMVYAVHAIRYNDAGAFIA